MKSQDLMNRTLEFCVRVIKFAENLPETNATRIISGQLLRASSSVGANYRASRRSKSTRDFVNKLKIMEEESDESLYWLQLLDRSNLGDPIVLHDLIKEANELVSIFVSSLKTAKANLELHNKTRK